jgi:SSS family transporter
MAVLSIVYTALGGMEAVVWTDVVQTIVLLGGMLVSLGVVLWLVGGPGVVWRTAMADDKLRMFHWSWDSTTMTTWLVFIGSFALQFGPYTTDQAVIQRYLSTKDEKAAAKSLWTNGILSIPFGFLFMALGTCLYVYLKQSPEQIAVGMKNDQVFPLFIVQQLPAGVSGLVIAGVFAASMSTLDSSMHSIATTVTIDWYQRFKPEATDHQSLRLARVIIVIVGLLAMGIAVYMARTDIKSAFFLFQKILGLISSALVGIFILGVFTKRANTIGALAGAAVSLGLLLYIFFYTQLHFYMLAVIGIPTCVVVGYVVSLATPQWSRPTDGLNWPTRTEAVEEGE